MSTSMQTTSQPAATTSTGMGGLCVSSGTEGAVTSALSQLEQILCQINYQELLENEYMAVANKNVSEDGAECIIKQGQQQLVDSLAQGVGTMSGSLVSLGTMAYGEYRDPYAADIENLNEEIKGVENYQEALPQKCSPSINEFDISDPIAEKIKELKEKKSFVDQDGKALTVSEEEKSLLETFDQCQETPDLRKRLEKEKKGFMKSRKNLLNTQGANRQTFATLGGSMGQIAHGMGTSIGAFAKKAGMEAQAAAQLDTSSSQSMLSIMGQLLKTANDALSQAQQTIQNIATISNGNRYN